jgi:hypothetical protein
MPSSNNFFIPSSHAFFSNNVLIAFNVS